MLGALELSPGMIVADVGAGRGYFARPIAHAVGPGGRVVATDVDAEALASLAGSRVVTRRVTADEPGLEPAHYDRILVAQVDHLLADRAGYFRALARALRPGGRIVVSNRLPYLRACEQAAAAAGLRELRRVDLPAQFLVIYEVPHA